MPDLPSLLSTANTHARAGRFHEAAALMEDAARLAPADASIQLSLGMMRSTIGDFPAAEAALRRAAELAPRTPEPHLYLGIILANQQRIAEADAAYTAASRLAPGRPDIAHAWSRLLADTARADQAIAVIREALRAYPRDIALHDKLCGLLNYPADIPPAEVFAAHRAFGHLIGAPTPIHRISDFNPDRRLRLAYLSGDLREHSVSYFLEPLLEHHDRTRFEVFCYHVGAPDETTTPRLRSRVPHWRHLFPISDRDLASAIAADGIDILVELAGHAQGNRLAAVALGPAPILVSFIGYPNTTGVPAIRYRFVDAVTDPPDADALATETLIRLPGCFLCYRPYDDPPAVQPRDPGRPITFGSFNNLAKLSHAALDLWGRLLAGVPHARLLLKGRGLGDDSIRAHILSRLSAFGITPDRVELLPHTKTTREHLALYHHVDIALDPFPYHGTTTTCEALFMGVPVVTLAGHTHAMRVGASLLTAVNLAEFITTSDTAYIAAATALAASPARLADLRASLRSLLLRSPLCDGRAYAAKVETAYRSIWTAHGSANPRP
ncbi:MAG: tetratricopeptide repeat protein [Phycisphaeraceae bacterium]|nr:tetratricopeptide repeat protein [Phycisphaeraceae bacterium]